ncbi:hypothetical protein [Roseovarius aestuarii]|uniref:Uncharacterized protein n=1 Tax=Roseovarius aestuarii TaxID=475083 RepID=A0A1X7BSR8_9RHOB|nr:hypothetical protein [Roseovarius aestuarii]SMC12249.1 hypothetical protein ROA7745_02072 [Roseovarius aestuarii]
MAEALELIFSFVAIGIYGSEERPRHPVWRNSIRIVAFAGAAIVYAILLAEWDLPDIASFLILPWLACSCVVLLGEYYLGSKKLGVVAIIIMLLLLVVSIVQMEFL